MSNKNPQVTDSDLEDLEVTPVNDVNEKFGPVITDLSGIVHHDPPAVENLEGQTYLSPESQQAPAGTRREDEEPQPALPLDAADSGNVKRTVTDDGYIVEEYTQNVEGEDNDFEAVDAPEENDLEK